MTNTTRRRGRSARSSRTQTAPPSGFVSVDLRLLRRGRERGGVFTRSEAVADGVSDGALGRRLQTGMLTRVHPGVYVIEPIRTPDTPLAAALAACTGAVVSHSTAAGLHGFVVPESGVHLTVPKGHHRRLADVTLHESRLLGPSDVTTVRGLSVTTPARTLLDLSTVVRPARFSALLDRQLTQEHPSTDEFLAAFSSWARKGREGSALARRHLPEITDGDPRPQSELERLVDRLLRSSGLMLRRQYRPPWYEGREGIVDFADVPGRTIVEADGRRWHASQIAMATDRTRDRLAATNDWLVVRVTWHEVVHRRQELADELAQIVWSRRRRAA